MATRETVELSARVQLLPGGVNCALVIGEDRQAVVVDSGQDRDAGRDLRRACERLGVTPVAIVTTHAHADHFGGNAYLLRQFPELRVYAPEIERSLMADPYLEPVYLFHGARPPAELTSKWLQAEASPVHEGLEPGPLELAGVRFEVIDTSGHAHRQRALLVDGVLLAADAVFGPEVLRKYPLPFGQDVAAQRRAMEVVGGSGAALVVPGHGAPNRDAAELAAENLRVLDAAAEAVLAACDGVGLEGVLARTCRTLGIAIADLPRYHLNLCTVAAHLTRWREQGRVEARLDDGALRWSRHDPARA